MHLLMLLVTVCWASNIIAGKQALTGFGAPALAQLRMLGTAAVYLIAFVASGRMRRLPLTPRKELFLVIVAAAGIALNQITFIGGMALSTVAHAGLIVALGPVMVLVIAVVIHLEALTAWKLTGMVLAFAGVAILTLDKAGQGSSSQFLGDLILVASTLVFAIYTILVKEVADRFDALTLNTFIFVLGALMMFPFCAHAVTLTNWAGLTFEAWWGLGFMIVFGSVMSYLLFAYVLTELAASRVAAFNYLQPVIAAGLAIWLLSERLTSKVLIGGSLILAGVCLAERERGEEKAGAASDPQVLSGRNPSRNHFDDGAAVLRSQDKG
jgi:drug/metabolite transporter (DMT)-like permease